MNIRTLILFKSGQIIEIGPALIDVHKSESNQFLYEILLSSLKLLTYFNKLGNNNLIILVIILGECKNSGHLEVKNATSKFDGAKSGK